MDWAAWIEATAVADALRRSRWVYPLVNAGHVLGVALLVGAVLPMNAALLRGRPALWLRPWAAAGLALAVVCGAALFAAQATDYAASGWFRAKMAVLAVAAGNAALHLFWRPGRGALVLSMAAWPAVLILGRMIAYG